MTWCNPKLKAVTKRGGTANYSVSASRAVDDGSGHSSPSHLGQFCGRDDGGHRRFPPGKPTPEGSPSELEEKAAYSFAKKRNSTCNWGNTKRNRAYKSAFRYQMSWPQPKYRERHFQLFWVQKRLREAAMSWWLLQLALCPWELPLPRLSVAHPAGDANSGLSSGLSPAAQGCRWSALEPSPAAPQWPRGCCRCPALQGRARRCQSSAASHKEKWSKLMCSGTSCQC